MVVGLYPLFPPQESPQVVHILKLNIIKLGRIIEIKIAEYESVVKISTFKNIPINTERVIVKPTNSGYNRISFLLTKSAIIISPNQSNQTAN